MKIKPTDFELHISASPTAAVCTEGRVLSKLLDRIRAEFRFEATSCADLLLRVNNELKSMKTAVPMRAAFIDGVDGVETNNPEFMHTPVLMIFPLDPSGDIFPNLH